jgi:hypothetical protein
MEVDYSSREDPLRVSPGVGCVVDDALHLELYAGRPLRRTDDLVYRLCDELRLIVLHIVSASLGERIAPMAEPTSRLRLGMSSACPGDCSPTSPVT